MSRSVPFAAIAALASIPLVSSPALAQSAPAMSWQPAYSGNYSSRNGATIDMIVIHKAEGSLDATVSWFRNPAARVSAHYCVDDNQISHMVDDAANAWHCGNGPYNHRSIGIENSGFTYRDDFDDAHYRRLASLVAFLCAKHGIPVDRHHIIGHNEVPDPNRPGHYGGAGGHTDPGPYFNWTLFMSYVRSGSSSPVTQPQPQPQPPVRGQPQPGSGGDQAVSVTATALNVRDGAWGTIVGQATHASGWVLTGNQDQGFVEIYFRGATAWIYEGNTTGYSGTGAQVDVASLNVRDGAGTGSNIVAQVLQDQVYVEAGTSPDGSWTQIRFDENRRWIYKPYTTDVSLSP